jgi:signal peptidase
VSAGGYAAVAPASHRAEVTARRRTSDSWLAGVTSALMTGLVVVALAAAVALAVVPRLLGGASLTVLSGSMEPLYSPGDVVVVESVTPEEVQVGDIVAFQPVSGEPTLITHRVVAKQLGGVEGTYFITRGDANGADDDPIVGEQIMGRAVYHLPVVGHVALWAGGHEQTIVTGAGVVLVAYALVMIVRPSRKRAAA